MSGRANRVKPVLRKALKKIKPTNTPNRCVVEEICLPQNPHIQKKIGKFRDFRETSYSREKIINSKKKNQKVNFSRKIRFFFRRGKKVDLFAKKASFLAGKIFKNAGRSSRDTGRTQHSRTHGHPN